MHTLLHWNQVLPNIFFNEQENSRIPDLYEKE